jgi:polar amino acid transport system permease protein
VASEGDRRSDPEVELERAGHGSAVAGRRRGGGGVRSTLIALVSTVVFFSLVAFVVTRSANWPEVKAQFFDRSVFRDSMPDIARAFLLNVKIFCIAEAFILVLALLLAVLRSLPGPVFFPVRALAIVYADLFRGVPTVLVITLLGLGVPALALQGVPSSVVFWATVGLILIYTAYVSEVYRAGIESVHRSQEVGARSLGLTRMQSLRFVILPQAVRRVMPPLLNDFIGLQKDTALVGTLGVIDAFNQANIDVNATFNYTPYLAAAVLFVAITIPLTRLTDWLVARDRRRRQVAGVA